ncbi:MAG: hypothetical protein MJZ13_09595 [Bacteroidales bacterium]|nr:hypothetical protein [Bacteroidales bacterium]
MRKFKTTTFALLAALSLVSCDEEVQNFDLSSENPEIKVTEGTLHFSSAEEFFKVNSDIANMDEDTRKNWEEHIGFKSLHSTLAELEELYEFSDTLISIYPQYYTIIDSITTRTIPLSYSAIADAQGVFYVQNTIHKVDGDNIAFDSNGNIETVTELLQQSIVSDGNNKGVFNYQMQSHLKVTKINKEENIISDAGYSGGKNTYKCLASFRLYSLLINDNGYKRYQYECEGKLENRKHKLGKYREHHATGSSFEDIVFAYSIEGIQSNISRNFPQKKSTHKDGLVTYSIIYKITNQTTETPLRVYFNSLVGTVKTDNVPSFWLRYYRLY